MIIRTSNPYHALVGATGKIYNNKHCSYCPGGTPKNIVKRVAESYGKQGWWDTSHG